jgi:hypothetical protein
LEGIALNVSIGKGRERGRRVYRRVYYEKEIRCVSTVEMKWKHPINRAIKFIQGKKVSLVAR